MNTPANNSIPFFSVITVVFNDLAGFRRTEASVRGQKERSFEWIVVDGASKDGTVEYLRTLDLPYLNWASERDRGIYDAMNKGTARSLGRYVIYMNGGDEFKDPDCLSDTRRCLEEANFPELLYAGGNWRFANGHLRYRPPRKIESGIRHCLPAMHQATFYRRDFLDVPPYELRYPVSADYYVSARCFARGAKAAYLERSICIFEVGGNSSKLDRLNKSLLECWHIQQTVLKLNIFSRLMSAMRRIVAHRRYVVFQRMYASKAE